MSNAVEALTIQFPNSISADDVAAIRQEIAAISGVDQVGSGDTRSIDPATVEMIQTWVTLAGTVITTAGGAVALIKQIVDLFRSKGIKNAEIDLGDGRVIKADEISAHDLKKLVATG